MSADVMCRACVNCGQAYIIMSVDLLRLPEAAMIIGDALDKHQQSCRNTCSHCSRRMPTVNYDRDMCSTRCADEARRQRRRADAEDVIHLVACGLSVDDALARVGWTREAALTWVRRHDRGDLGAVLASGVAA